MGNKTTGQQRSDKQLNGVARRRAALHLCIAGTQLDTGASDTKCDLGALPGSDYCENHLATARSCVVRCCIGKPYATKRKQLCEAHYKEREANKASSLKSWLFSRPNEQAARLLDLRKKKLSSAPGFVSLEAIGVVLGFVALAAFVVSGFAILAGGVLKDDVVVVLGALGFIGCLAFFAFLVMQGHKERGPRE